MAPPVKARSVGLLPQAAVNKPKAVSTDNGA